MAQLNPTFEIDFNDINSYEQIQLINDTQLAKENLLMHRAYKEPSDDEIIRNHFSSFTFVDFCPKLFTSSSSSSHCLGQPAGEPFINAAGSETSTDATNQTDGGAKSFKYYELESFSDLFERINAWLKLNKDWRVVSMQTLIYDCSSQFNHVKSSIYSSHLPQNTRGLRLYLSPSKSRFSGPQKIGCINVVPRKVSGSHSRPDEPIVYETLDQILNRLNELLLTRPIEGRILSVETITLPMANGYVNTESNYFVENRLKLLNQITYSLECTFEQQATSGGTGGHPIGRGHSLIDILRVYYEFGPMVCGLVNLIDFVPRFYSPTPTSLASCELEQSLEASEGVGPNLSVPKLAASESLTRVIRRSLAWFEGERKRVLELDNPAQQEPMNLKVCNLQVSQKTVLRAQLVQAAEGEALPVVKTRAMAHERATPIACSLCSGLSTQMDPRDWCSHLRKLAQPYEVKFVRLAYVVPVASRQARQLLSMGPLKGSLLACTRAWRRQLSLSGSSASRRLGWRSAQREGLSAPEKPDKEVSGEGNGPQEERQLDCQDEEAVSEGDEDEEEEPDEEEEDQDDRTGLEGGSVASQAGSQPELAESMAMSTLQDTNRRHLEAEMAHQLKQADDGLQDAPIGQLSYRLFAPCQLVNSSSCFAINPVNSSSPLSRRGSVNLHGSGSPSDAFAAESACSTSLSSNRAQAASSWVSPESQQMIISFGALFPAMAHEVLASSAQASDAASGAQLLATPGNRFTSNEFEPVAAIRRRMEVYVTTNCMKVIAAETLIVNLSDSLSCLSTAIEQSVVPASQCLRRQPSTWVSIYLLYAAVDEPLLPEQLLVAQQHHKRQQHTTNLAQIHEQSENCINNNPAYQSIPQNLDSLFDDDFKDCLLQPVSNQSQAKQEQSEQPIEQIHTPDNQAGTQYNSAYDRTVPLPTAPDNHEINLDSLEFLGAQSDSLWFRPDSTKPQASSSSSAFQTAEQRRKSANKRNRQLDSQCSIM